jgi:hypothetical protein
MNVRWHWLQQKVHDEHVILHHLRTSFQVADVLTKGVDHGTFKRLSDVLMGAVPLWEYGGGVLRRALHPSNSLTSESLTASGEHERRIQQQPQRPSSAAQEQAALMYGSSYRGDVTGDGPATRPSTSAQEQAATMYGSRYSGDVTGDGPGHGLDRTISWPDLRSIAAALHPDEPPYTNITTFRNMQLTANVTGSVQGAAEALIRHLGRPTSDDEYGMGDVGGMNDAVMEGTRELEEMVAITSALVYLTANRIATRIQNRAVNCNAAQLPPLTRERIVAAVNEVHEANAGDPDPDRNISLLQPRTVIPSTDDWVLHFAGPVIARRRMHHHHRPPMSLADAALDDQAQAEEADAALEALRLAEEFGPINQPDDAKMNEVLQPALPFWADGVDEGDPPAYPPDDEPMELVAAPTVSRAFLLAGITCRRGASAWSIRRSQNIIALHAMNPTNDATVAITTNGRRYHHVCCHTLLCQKGAHKGLAYHGGTVIQLSSIVRSYNVSREASEQMTACGFCGDTFMHLFGRLPC